MDSDLQNQSVHRILGSLVECPTKPSTIWIRIRTEEEQMAVILPNCSWICRSPVAINVKILVVESCWRIVPLGDLDGTCLVTDVDQIKSISTTVRIIIIGNGV